MTGRLHNKRILLTRPQHQSEKLSNLIIQQDGDVTLFPTIEIKPLKTSTALSACFNNPDQYTYIIFVSRNAVSAMFGNYALDLNQIEIAQFIAIGAATAEELGKHGIVNVLHAGESADSETLLNKPELQSDIIDGKRILIVRGVGGRELLAETLSQRGAKVDYAEVYQRCLPDYDEAYIKQVWHDAVFDALICSSDDGLKNLLQLIPENMYKNLFNTPVVLMSQRTVGLAKALGFVSRLEVAEAKSDQGLLLALFNIIGE